MLQRSCRPCKATRPPDSARLPEPPRSPAYLHTKGGRCMSSSTQVQTGQAFADVCPGEGARKLAAKRRLFLGALPMPRARHRRKDPQSTIPPSSMSRGIGLVGHHQALGLLCTDRYGSPTQNVQLSLQASCRLGWILFLLGISVKELEEIIKEFEGKYGPLRKLRRRFDDTSAWALKVFWWGKEDEESR